MAIQTPPLPEVSISLPTEATYRVWVARYGYHTAILIEQPDGWHLGPPGQETAPIVEYAWGDRAYYMESDHRLPVLLAALFLPTESVMYVRAHNAPPTRQTGIQGLYVREVDAATLQRLVQSLEQTFVRTPGSNRQPPFSPVSTYRGRFYPGRTFYIFWSACNAWTVRHLKQAGLAHSSFFVILEQQVPGRLSNFRRVY
ncbi:MAG TPA: DUF2459 domain-containing protein [Rhodothermales bacterium]|nr:DUF2459 domain-containing protein [Rhodothermales bacterium]